VVDPSIDQRSYHFAKNQQKLLGQTFGIATVLGIRQTVFSMVGLFTASERHLKRSRTSSPDWEQAAEWAPWPLYSRL